MATTNTYPQYVDTTRSHWPILGLVYSAPHQCMLPAVDTTPSPYPHPGIIVWQFLQAFRYDAHPMGMVMSAMAALGTFYLEQVKVMESDLTVARTPYDCPQTRPT